MTLDNFVRLSITAISVVSIFYIPKNKYRLAVVSFLIAQAVAWASSLVVVQLGLISYPVRLFPKATRGSFVHLFVFLPTLYTWFILLFPKNAAWLKRVMHYFVFVSISAWYIYFMIVYTNLQRFTKGSLTFQFAFMYIRYLVFFFIMRLYITWFTKRTNMAIGG